MSKSIRLKIMMFLQFFVWGAFFVPMGSYLGQIFAEYQEQGTLNSIIGSTYATQTWAALFAPLIVGFIADRIFNKEYINGVLHLIGAALLWWCSTITNSPDEFFWVMLAFFLCYMPTLALVNAITFQNVESIENEFPHIRVWGTIGWIASGLVVSQSMFGILPLPILPGIENAGSTNFPLRLAAVVSAIYGVYSFTLAFLAAAGSRRADQHHQGARVGCDSTLQESELPRVRCLLLPDLHPAGVLLRTHIRIHQQHGFRR